MTTSGGVRHRRILTLKDIDSPDDLQEALVVSYEKLTQIVKSSHTSSEFLDGIQRLPPDVEHHTIVQGLLFAILITKTSENELRQSLFRQLTFNTKDGHHLLCSLLYNLFFEKYTIMTGTSRMQGLWLVEELASARVRGIENTAVAIVRQIQGGRSSQSTLWLVNSLISMFKRQRQWFLEQDQLVSIVIYRLLRSLLDHRRGDESVLSLKRVELEFVVNLMCQCPQQWQDIGRDVIRLLTELQSEERIREIWDKFLIQPGVKQEVKHSDDRLHSSHGVPLYWSGTRVPNKLCRSLLATPTPSLYTKSLLTPEMEKQLMFVFLSVPFDCQGRYLSWIAQSFFPSDDNPHISETIIVDFVRFVCTAWAPTPQQVQARLCYRWTVLWWLVSTPKTEQCVASMRTALLWEMMYYQRSTQDFRCVEPVYRLMMENQNRGDGKLTVDILNTLTHQLKSQSVLYDESYESVKVAFAHCVVLTKESGPVTLSHPSFVSCPNLREKLGSMFSEHFDHNSTNRLKRNAPQSASVSSGSGSSDEQRVTKKPRGEIDASSTSVTTKSVVAALDVVWSENAEPSSTAEKDVRLSRVVGQKCASMAPSQITAVARAILDWCLARVSSSLYDRDVLQSFLHKIRPHHTVMGWSLLYSCVPPTSWEDAIASHQELLEAKQRLMLYMWSNEAATERWNIALSDLKEIWLFNSAIVASLCLVLYQAPEAVPTPIFVWMCKYLTPPQIQWLCVEIRAGAMVLYDDAAQLEALMNACCTNLDVVSLGMMSELLAAQLDVQPIREKSCVDCKTMFHVCFESVEKDSALFPGMLPILKHSLTNMKIDVKDFDVPLWILKHGLEFPWIILVDVALRWWIQRPNGCRLLAEMVNVFNAQNQAHTAQIDTLCSWLLLRCHGARRNSLIDEDIGRYVGGCPPLMRALEKIHMPLYNAQEVIPWLAQYRSKNAFKAMNRVVVS